MKTLKPFFYYFGSKARSSIHYPAPIYQTIIEPFCGSAGYSLRYYYKDVYLSDIDEKVVGTWDYLIHASEMDILKLPNVSPGMSVTELNICQEARWLIGWWLNGGSSQPKNTPSASMRSGRSPSSFWGINIKARIADQLEYIRHWKVTCAHYTCVDNMVGTWFVDPPYQNAGVYYKYGSTKLDYQHLASWCRSRAGEVIVCENYGASWLPFEYLGTFRGTIGHTSECVFHQSNPVRVQGGSM